MPFMMILINSSRTFPGVYVYFYFSISSLSVNVPIFMIICTFQIFFFYATFNSTFICDFFYPRGILNGDFPNLILHASITKTLSTPDLIPCSIGICQEVPILSPVPSQSPDQSFVQSQ